MTRPRINREIFARLWNDHTVPVRKIADAMGVTVSAVSHRAKRMGLPPRNRGGRCRAIEEFLAANIATRMAAVAAAEQATIRQRGLADTINPGAGRSRKGTET